MKYFSENLVAQMNKLSWTEKGVFYCVKLLTVQKIKLRYKKYKRVCQLLIENIKKWEDGKLSLVAMVVLQLGEDEEEGKFTNTYL